jgi:hypothetical protein
MTQPHAHPPSIEAAQSDAVKRRSEAANDFRRKEWLWEIALLVAATIWGGAILLLAMTARGVISSQFSPESTFCAGVLIGLFGAGLFFLCRDRLFRLRNASNANLISLIEAESLQKIYQVANNGGSVEVLNALEQAAMALTRGAPISAGTTNQTLDLARMEGKTAPKPPETVFGSTAILQHLADMIRKQNGSRSDADASGDAKRAKQ